MNNTTNENINIAHDPSIYVLRNFKIQKKLYNNEYIWVCEKMYNNLQNGDICLFGGKDGYKYYGKIKDKRLMNNLLNLNKFCQMSS